MPRIEIERVLPGLWIAWCQNDYGERTDKRLGITADHARARVLRALS